MQVRRCVVAWLEPREVASFEMGDLLAGGTGVVSRLAWFAHAPHLPEVVEVEAAHAPLLGALGAVDWIARAELDAKFGRDAVDALLAAGLLLAKPEDNGALADDAFRAAGWHPSSAVAHMAARWQGIDGPQGMADTDTDTNAGLLRQHGAPPPHVRPSDESEPTLRCRVSSATTSMHCSIHAPLAEITTSMHRCRWRRSRS
jgi:hypothetical protein